MCVPIGEVEGIVTSENMFLLPVAVQGCLYPVGNWSKLLSTSRNLSSGKDDKYHLSHIFQFDNILSVQNTPFGWG